MSRADRQTPAVRTEHVNSIDTRPEYGRFCQVIIVPAQLAPVESASITAKLAKLAMYTAVLAKEI